MSGDARIAWRAWGAAAFDEAREAERLVLLSGTASWSADARTLHDRVLSHPSVAQTITDLLIPVRFDADRLPHVRDRYNSGGWPITALLTPRGDLLWAGHATSPEQLRDFIRQAATAWQTRREQLEEEVRRRELAGTASRTRHGSGLVRRESGDDVLTAAQATFDARNGGFGDSWKPILPDIIELLLVQGHRLDNPDWIGMATRTLDGMLAGEVLDRKRGGFFRLARNADWTGPSTEKLLEANAWALRSFGMAGHVLDNAEYREVAETTVAWAERVLALPDGLWGGSQSADEGYYAGGHADAEPDVDRTVFTDACAQWIAALAEVGGRFGREDWIARAASALDTLLTTQAADDGLLHHYRAPDEAPALPGLLSDVAEAARACVTVAQVTGDSTWLRRATTLADAMLAHFWSDEGGFCDVAPVVEKTGALRHETRPFETNATAASLLCDLAMLDGGRRWRGPAESTLAMLSPIAGHYGVGAAGFALAVEHHFEPPRSFVVVGRGEAADRLRAAALAVPTLDRQVWSLPDGGTVAGRRFEPADPPVVFACSARRCSAPMSSPEELRAATPRL